MVKRTANAVWKGSLKEGNGVVSTERGVLSNAPYNWSGRFADGTVGTNPEELIAAALGSCFSMAASGDLGKLGIVPQSVETRATLSFEKVNEKMTVVEIHLDTVVHAAGADATKVQQALEGAKAGCPISRLLTPGTKITLSWKLA